MLRKIGRVIKKWWKLTVAIYALFGLSIVLEQNLEYTVDRKLAWHEGDSETLERLDSRRWVFIPQCIVENIQKMVGHIKRLINGLS